MADHRIAHPEPVENCFGCKTLGIGFQGLQSRLGADPVQTVPIVADDGNRAGQTVGRHEIHWDGRKDAVAMAPTTVMRAAAQELA